MSSPAITIRRCRGNRQAWAACWADTNLLITTAIGLGRLVEAMRERFPQSAISVETASDPGVTDWLDDIVNREASL